MIVASIAAFLFAFVASVCAQTPSVDGQYTISSPTVNGIYVAGQVLPITYLITDATGATIQIRIVFASVPGSGNISSIVTEDAPLLKTNPVTQTGDVNITYYQNSINYNISPTTPAGDYQVIFETVTTGANTTIPIHVNAAVPSTTSTTPLSSGVSASAGPSRGTTGHEEGTAAHLVARGTLSLTVILSVILFLGY